MAKGRETSSVPGVFKFSRPVEAVAKAKEKGSRVSSNKKEGKHRSYNAKEEGCVTAGAHGPLLRLAEVYSVTGADFMSPGYQRLEHIYDKVCGVWGGGGGEEGGRRGGGGGGGRRGGGGG